MDELTFVLYNRPTRAHVDRVEDTVVLRVGRRRLAFPSHAVPALVKMIVDAALRERESAD